MATSTPTLIEARAGFQKSLLRWFRANKRSLPWRTVPSLYGTIVSEFMLQQTQVKTVLPFFEAWMTRFPDFAALASASEAEVVKAWEGLGYYSRARNLHRLAKAVAAMPAPPREAEGWLALPGVGPYTAAAISSIACGAPVACVDGNIVRVLARLTNDRTAFPDNGSAVKHFAALATEVLNRRHPGEHNEAMMELGATICTKANPRCDVCPVAKFCEGFASGEPASMPRIARKTTVKREVTRAWIVNRGRVLLHRARPGSRLEGLHELPEVSSLAIEAPGEAPILVRTRSITHHRITEKIFRVSPTEELRQRAAADSSLVWTPLDSLDSVTFSGPHKRWIAQILAEAHA